MWLCCKKGGGGRRRKRKRERERKRYRQREKKEKGREKSEREKRRQKGSGEKMVTMGLMMVPCTQRCGKSVKLIQVDAVDGPGQNPAGVSQMR